MPKKTASLSSSFRDPSGFLFSRDDVLYRQINREYQSIYEKLNSSGLYAALIKKGWLIPHDEVDNIEPEKKDTAYKIIRPEKIGFISYPYEWSFSQLKDAALLTLKIHELAIDKGLTLKDASAYNIQFYKGKPVLIDTLSFDDYEDGKPWDAYRQFCQHFLAPLALMAKVDIRLNQLMRVYIDGIPLDMASKLLPWSTRLNLGLFTHIHVHANAQKKYSESHDKASGDARVSKTGLLGLVDNLRSTVKGLEWKPQGTEWADYYDITNYSSDAFEQKKNLVKSFVQKTGGGIIWDMGANTGEFSRPVSDFGSVVSFDIDPAAVEKNYRQVKSAKETNILPLVLDLTNPSGGIGWANKERDSLASRGPADVVLALALIHHICISNNVPLENFAEYLRTLGKNLVIEFVPKEDSQVQILLATRKDIFPNYTLEGFEEAFTKSFEIVNKMPVEGSLRVLYLMKSKDNI
ncbi:MAG: class I SAM-dependent methyltransferase [Chloroflexi bacterium]|nr:class I SAM-dependent methyltransferase [Chloroflexota bacterium]